MLFLDGGDKSRENSFRQKCRKEEKFDDEWQVREEEELAVDPTENK